MKKNFHALLFLLMLFCLYSCNSTKPGPSNQKKSFAGPEVKSVFINGDSIHYIELGSGDPVVFVHGSLGDYRGFKGQLDTFASKHRVIVYSRRYAFPDKQTINDSLDYSITLHIQDLSEFLKHLNLGPVHLIGHSYGGSIALHITLAHPELVRTLTLIEPPVPSLLQNVAGGDTVWKNFETRFKIPAANEFKKGNNERAVNIFVGGVTGDSLAFSKIPELYRNMIMENILELRGFALDDKFFITVTCNELKQITVPVLLVGGANSPILFSSILNELERCLSNRERVVLPNASHGAQNDNAFEFNKTTLNFINRH
jgi:pimeloyl-ACP methyl ester carboxylesterase